MAVKFLNKNSIAAYYITDKQFAIYTNKSWGGGVLKIVYKGHVGLKTYRGHVGLKTLYIMLEFIVDIQMNRNTLSLFLF